MHISPNLTVRPASLIPESHSHDAATPAQREDITNALIALDGAGEFRFHGIGGSGRWRVSFGGGEHGGGCREWLTAREAALVCSALAAATATVQS
jgi:hypothetical protein